MCKVNVNLGWRRINAGGLTSAELTDSTKIKQTLDGVERDIEQTVERKRPGYLEVVHHLYSMELKHGPVILRLRTQDRAQQNHVASFTPVWRGAEFQEREVFDLYGV